MTEPGGPATQSGIYYQNSVAALALADLLDFGLQAARERLIEVRVEAPEHVDDIVLRYVDDHRQFMNVKLSLQVGDSAWNKLWDNLAAQVADLRFNSDDMLTIVVGNRSGVTEALAELCERARAAVDQDELDERVNAEQKKILASIRDILGPQVAFEALRRVTLRHLSEEAIESELSRRRLAGGHPPPPELLSVLRDMVGGKARRRGLFRAAPLRRQLKLDQGVVLAEPPEWGLASYRIMVASAARIEIPGLRVSGPSEKLFVWPRARNLDLAHRSDFEDEDAASQASPTEATVDMAAFPSESLDRVVVVAGPGFGKSALLTAIAGRLAPGPYVPVVIPLASLSASEGSIVEFLGQQISRDWDLGADWQLLAEQGLLVPLLDGLDEVAATHRPALLKKISNFSRRYPHSPWILTVRDSSIVDNLADAKAIELLPLNDADIERFVEAMKEFIGEIRGWVFVNKLKNYPDLDRLARIPLFLAMLLVTTDLDSPKPLTRSDLIEGYLKTLFTPAAHKDIQDRADRSEALRSIAEVLAFERIEMQEIGASEREVRSTISRTVESVAEAQTLFVDLTSNGILKKQSAIRLQFPYPIVQEYLAACHLIAKVPDTLEHKIEDAVQRPWAQVIQFALEMHPNPAPIIRSMLTRPDDGFKTGLRLIGRCIANGAKVDDDLRQEVGDRLVDYWGSAPSQPRQKVGKILQDGFSDPPSPKLLANLHHRWLMNSGAGEILSKLADTDLTTSVLTGLLTEEPNDYLFYPNLQPALSAAGDVAFACITDAMAADKEVEKGMNASHLLGNFARGSVSEGLLMSVARDESLHPQARMRAYALSTTQLEPAAVALAEQAFREEDWNKYYEAQNLIPLHEDPPHFFGAILLDPQVSPDRKKGLASYVGEIFSDSEQRSNFITQSLASNILPLPVRLTFELVEARHGNKDAFTRLIDGLLNLPNFFATLAISLFGHYRDLELAERAVHLLRSRELSPAEISGFANSSTTAMLHIFEMDIGFSGTLRSAPAHPAIPAWVDLLEEWAERADLDIRQKFNVLRSASELGSERARSQLETLVLATDPGTPEWLVDDSTAYGISNAIREVQRRNPVLPTDFVELVLQAGSYNVVARGIASLQAQANRVAVDRLIELNQSAADWHIRDAAANALEGLGSKLGLVIQRQGRKYAVVGNIK